MTAHTAHIWVAIVVAFAVLDVLAYAVAPRDAFNPFHPHPAPFRQAPFVPHVRLKRVCWPVQGSSGPRSGRSCFYEANGRYGP